ncbi:cytochrome P450 [Aspergillus alliaceus]|uniref:Cytochrome P450 n=1 Tax=Petromyces alliaceus TaxID=209559 RepID=A0A5N7BW29_PETAA|nr:cytochrome P450 [Aspergillus alliaceus]
MMLSITKWHENYGPIISVHFGPQMVIILGSHDCVHDLLGKRGALYSSCPEYYIEGVGDNFHTAALPYGQQWRRHRRIFAASLTFSLAYGDEYEVDRIMKNILEQVKLPAVAFPIFKCVPIILAPWKKRAKRLFKEQQTFFSANLKRALVRTHWSWSQNVINTKPARDCGLNELASVIGANYEAGSDTTAFVLEVFVLAGLLHKDAVSDAQAEVDALTGLRMPEWKDLPSLPYVHAFASEVLRWRPVVPGGLHHAVTETDCYMGHKIPKGTMIILNHWSLEFDPTFFPDPENFDPERWIQGSYIPSSAFGFGRRTCPGKQMAQNSLAVTITRMLWTFNFYPVHNMGDIYCWNMTQGISSRPSPFRVSLRPRSEEHREVIWHHLSRTPKRLSAGSWSNQDRQPESPAGPLFRPENKA